MTQTARYLLALYVAEHRSTPPVSSGRLAEMLDCSPATATDAVQRLESEGLVAYEPYEGATLTDAGRERAAAVHETYVALSWFFRSELDLDAPEREAKSLVGDVSPSVADRLVATLLHGLDADDDDS